MSASDRRDIMMLEPPTKLRGDLLCLAELGGDPEALLRGSGVSYAAVLAQKPISSRKMAELFDWVAERAPEDFAFASGRAIHLHYLGILGYRMSNCETVGDLIETWSRYSIHIGYPLASRFERLENEWRMSFSARYPLSRRAYDFCVSSTLAGFSQSVFNLSGHRIHLLSMGLPVAAANDPGKFSALGADRLVFDCVEPYVTGSLNDLDLRITTADAELRQMCEELCRKLWNRANTPVALIDKLRELFSSDRVADLHGAGEALGMSSRSIQRRLSAEGTSFHELLDTSRRDRALEMVRYGSPGKTVAFDLGFADVSSFRRSFRRWTGMSCSEWRRAVRR